MGTPNKFVEALRDAVIPMVSRLAPFQHAFVQRLSELGVAYRGSPIVEGPGKRYLDDSIRGGNGIRSRFLLVLPNDADSTAMAAARQLAASFPDVVELRSTQRHGAALVRPDGYVACAGHNGDFSAALESARALLKRQTASGAARPPPATPVTHRAI